MESPKEESRVSVSRVALTRAGTPSVPRGNVKARPRASREPSRRAARRPAIAVRAAPAWAFSLSFIRAGPYTATVLPMMRATMTRRKSVARAEAAPLVLGWVLCGTHGEGGLRGDKT